MNSAPLGATPAEALVSEHRSRYLPWTEPTRALYKAWEDGPTPATWKAWRAEVKRAARTWPKVLDRQLARLGVDVLAFHVWRRERGLPRMAELTLPETERVMWWLLERASR